MDYVKLYDLALVADLVLMLFSAWYFLTAKTPDKPIFANFLRSRRLMAFALLTLSANYLVHLFVGLRFSAPHLAIAMNLSTYFLVYWLFSSAFAVLLNRHFLTVSRFLKHITYWIIYATIAICVVTIVPQGPNQKIWLLILAFYLFAYGIYLSYNLIRMYRRAVKLFDDTHSEHIAAYIRWMSVFTWWALIYGVSCGLLTFLPEHLTFLWVLSSIPFYAYLFCSYINYMLFYEKVETILENEPELPFDTDSTPNTRQIVSKAYKATIEKKLKAWISTDNYTTPGLSIADLATTLDVDRTALSSYIKTTFNLSFREWIVSLRIDFAKRMLTQHPGISISAVSEASGFLSLSYFTKIFRDKEGCAPTQWRKNRKN